jgi:tRNA nucleotidyltransferase (CCA-adding enzyme)
MSWQDSKSALSDLYHTLDPLPVEGVLFLMARSRKEGIRKSISLYLTRMRSKELLIGGDDLLALGLRPGPSYARILKKIRAAAIDGEAGSREKQLELAKSLIVTVLSEGDDAHWPPRGRKKR